jgi:hypothetical protein
VKASYTFILFQLTLTHVASLVLSQVWEGGPLFDFAGDFVGMNLVPSMKKSFFLPVRLISEQLQLFKSSQQRTVFLERVDKLMPKRYILQCFQFAVIHLSIQGLPAIIYMSSNVISHTICFAN